MDDSAVASAGREAEGRAPRLAEVVQALERRYPPHLAESWDRVGLVCGDPEAQVRRIHFAVDPVADVVAEAIELGADLVVAHHPLLLTPVSSVAATTPAGRVVHRLISSGIALVTAHTNADSASPGVSDALADVLGIHATTPLDSDPAEPVDRYVVFVPRDAADRVLSAMFAAGAGRVGDYLDCAFVSQGQGRFTPVPGSHPAVGSVGTPEAVEESRVEVAAPRALRPAVIAALLSAHPYEEPAYDVIELAMPGSGATGIGRVGSLPEPVSLLDFAERVATALPATRHGVRVSGDLQRTVQRVAVCGGSGDALLAAAARSGADAYVTADLRHHRALDHSATSGCALVDVAHWASEWPWLPVAARVLEADLAAAGTTVESSVSRIVTDPWSAHLTSPR